MPALPGFRGVLLLSRDCRVTPQEYGLGGTTTSRHSALTLRSSWADALLGTLSLIPVGLVAFVISRKEGFRRKS